MLTWPPTIADVKVDLKIDDDISDARLSGDLAAAIAVVERKRAGSFNFAGNLGSSLPAPTQDICLGTIRLAGRWHARTRSPDGLIFAGELGTSRVPSFDSDIEQLLGIGRFARPVIA